MVQVSPPSSESKRQSTIGVPRPTASMSMPVRSRILRWSLP